MTLFIWAPLILELEILLLLFLGHRTSNAHGVLQDAASFTPSTHSIYMMPVNGRKRTYGPYKMITRRTHLNDGWVGMASSLSLGNFKVEQAMRYLPKHAWSEAGHPKQQQNPPQPMASEAAYRRRDR